MLYEVITDTVPVRPGHGGSHGKIQIPPLGEPFENSLHRVFLPGGGVVDGHVVYPAYLAVEPGEDPVKVPNGPLTPDLHLEPGLGKLNVSYNFV